MPVCDVSTTVGENYRFGWAQDVAADGQDIEAFGFTGGKIQHREAQGTEDVGVGRVPGTGQRHHVPGVEGGELVESNDVDAFFSNPQSELGKKFVAQIQQFDLPPLYADRVKPQGSHPLVKLAFHGDNIEKPLLSHLTRAFDLDVSIIQAKIEHIHTSNIGLLIVELEGTPEQNDAAIAYLREQPIELEVLGYVEPTL